MTFVDTDFVTVLTMCQIKQGNEYCCWLMNVLAASVNRWNNRSVALTTMATDWWKFMWRGKYLVIGGISCAFGMKFFNGIWFGEFFFCFDWVIKKLFTCDLGILHTVHVQLLSISLCYLHILHTRVSQTGLWLCMYWPTGIRLCLYLQSAGWLK